MKGSASKTLLIIASIVFFSLVVLLVGTCSAKTVYNANVAVVSEAADGLDLQALSELLKKANSAEALEQALNSPGGINNLDLDEDGKVDFIKVSEYGNKSDAYGFSLTVEPEQGQEQEIATIEIAQDGEDADVEVHGNEQVYGADSYYHYRHPTSSYLLWAYFMRPHPYYASRYYYGYYPRYYGVGYAPVGRSVYTQRTSTIRTGSTATRASSSRVASRTNLSNPNAGRSANSGITSRMRSPTTTQKSFQTRNPSKTASSGGFGRSTGSTRSSSRTRSASSGGK